MSDEKRITIRCSHETHEGLMYWKAIHNRSLNGEIVQIFNDWLHDPDALERRARELRERG